MKAKILLILSLFGLISSGYGLDYYWVGNTGDWDDYGNHWATTSGGTTFHTQEPDSIDDVYFDANSFTMANQIVTVDDSAYCNLMDWAGVTDAPRFNIEISKRLFVYSSIFLNSGMTISGWNGRIYFMSLNSGNTLDFSGQNAPDLDLYFFRDSGEWNLISDLELGDVELRYGSFNTNGNYINVNNVITYGGTNLDLMDSEIDIRYRWIAFGGNLDAGTSNINLLSTGYAGFGGSTGQVYHNVNVPYQGPSVTPNIQFDGFKVRFSKINIGAKGTTLFDESVWPDSLIVGTGNFLTFSSNASDTSKIFKHFSLIGTCVESGGMKNELGGAGVANLFVDPAADVQIEYADVNGMNVIGSSITALNSVDNGGNTGVNFSSAGAKTFYWIGGTGNWEDPLNWSLTSGGSAGACIPGSEDDVVFDANSFSSSGKVDLNNIQNCKTMDWSGIDEAVTLDLNYNDLLVYGSLLIDAEVYIWYGDIHLSANDSGHVIDGGKSRFLGLEIYIDGITGEYTLTDSLSGPSRLQMQGGTLLTQSNLVRVGYFTLTDGHAELGNSFIYSWEGVSFQDNMNLGASNATLDIYGDESAHAYFGDNNAFNNIYFSGTQIETSYMSGRNATFNKIVFDAPGWYTFGDPMEIDTIIAGPGTNIDLNVKVIQVDSSLELNGGCAGSILFQNGDLIMPASSSITAFNAAFNDIDGSGGAAFIVNNCYDLGDNTGFTINAPVGAGITYYWIGDIGVWDDPTHWSLSSGGTMSGCIPGPNDDVIFDANSFTINNQYVYTSENLSICRNMTWDNVLSGSRIICQDKLSIVGSLVCDTNMVWAGYDQIMFLSPGNSIIDSKGVLFGDLDLVFSHSGTYDLVSDVVMKDRIFIETGTVNTNDVSIECAYISFGRSGDANVTPIINMGSSIIKFIGNWRWLYFQSPNTATINAGTSTIWYYNDGVTLSLTDFDGRGHDYYNLIIDYSKNLSLSNPGGSFNKIVLNADASWSGDMNLDSLIIGEGVDFTVYQGTDLNINEELFLAGKANNKINLTSNSSLPYNLNVAQGNVCAEYTDIYGATAGGGATFTAGLGCSDMGANSGWNFDTTNRCYVPDTSLTVVGNLIFCEGDFVLLKADSLNDTFQWFKDGLAIVGATDSIFAATESGSYFVQVWKKYSTDSSGSVIVQSVPTVSSNHAQTICPGDSLMVGGSFQNIPGIYSDTLISSVGCDSIVITDLQYSTVYEDTVSQQICQGDSLFLSGNYQFIDGYYRDTLASLGFGCDSIVITNLKVHNASFEMLFDTACNQYTSPSGKLWSATGSYQDTIANSNGCDSIIQIELIIYSTPVLATFGTDSICVGDSIVIGVNGASMYVWDQGLGNDSIHTLFPTTNITYEVIGNNGICTDTANIVVTVFANPNVLISGDDSVCAGSSLDLVASGGITYNWSNGVGSGSSVTVIPNSDSTFIVTGNNNGCTGQAQIDVIYVTTPTITATPTNSSICNGSSVVLTASGADQYEWDQGVGSGQSVNVSPTFTTIYTVTGTKDGCSSTDFVTVSVESLPSISAGFDKDVCRGDTITLTASGGVSYLWNSGLGSGSSVDVSPTASISYSVTGTGSNGCTNSDQVSVTVLNAPNPTLALIGVELVTGNYSLYKWYKDGIQVFSGIDNRFTPTENGAYTVEVFASNGCTAFSEPFIMNTLAISSMITNTTVKLFPNPAESQLFVAIYTVESNSIWNVEMYDLTGKRIKHWFLEQKGQNRLEEALDISQIPSGLYYIEILDEEGDKAVKVRKIAITK